MENLPVEYSESTMPIRRLGILCLPGRGHLYPATALGRRLKHRGFQVTVFNRNITRSIVRVSGLLFHSLDEKDKGFVDCRSPLYDGLGPNTLDIIYDHSLLVFRQAREAIKKTGHKRTAD